MPAWWWALPDERPDRPRPLPRRLVGQRVPGDGDRHPRSLPLAAALVPRHRRGQRRAVAGRCSAPARQAARGARRGPAARRAPARSTPRPPSCSASSATCTTARRRASWRWRSTSAWPRSASTATPRARASSSRGARRGAARRLSSCATSPAASARRCSPSAASARRSTRSPRAPRCRPPSSVDLDGRLPAPVEAAAYFVVAEALTNAAKHAGARARRCALWRENGRLRVGCPTTAAAAPTRRRRARRACASAGRGARRHARRDEPGRRPDDPACGAPVRVVIAEDLALLRDGLTRLLRDHGFDGRRRRRRRRGLLAAVDEHQPDVSVVDVRLPPGVHATRACARRWRPAGAIPGLAVLVLSQYVERTYAAELLADGARRRRLPAEGPRRRRARRSSTPCAAWPSGGTALDPEAVAQLLGRRDDGAARRAHAARARGARADGRGALERGDRRGAGGDRGRRREARLQHLRASSACRPPTRDHRRVLAVLAWLRG